MGDPKLLVSIGAMGGSIALYGDITDPAHSRYRMMVVDQTLTFLTGDESGLESRCDGGWLTQHPVIRSFQAIALDMP